MGFKMVLWKGAFSPDAYPNVVTDLASDLKSYLIFLPRHRRLVYLQNYTDMTFFNNLFSILAYRHPFITFFFTAINVFVLW